MKLLLSFLLCMVPAALMGGPVYDVTDLGALGGTTSAGHRINEQGQTVGAGTDRVGNQYALSGENSMTAITKDGAAWDVNRSGTIAGAKYVNGQSYAVTWDASGTHFLTGTGVGGAALGINDAGQVTGMTGEGRAFLTDFSGGVRDLGVMLGGDWAAGRAVNEFGQVAGYGTMGGAFLAFRWDEKGGYTALGTLGGRNSYGMGINDSGVVAGHAQTSSGYLHAAVWTNSRAQDIGTLGGHNSYAYGINYRGAVVGYSQVSNGDFHAFLFQDGVLYDLNDLLGNNTGWELRYAFGINNQGQIVGEGLYQGQVHAFRLDLQRVLSMLFSLSGGESDGSEDQGGSGNGPTGLNGPTGFNGPTGYDGPSGFSGPTNLTSVPEPSSWALGLAGLALGVARWARRR